MKDLEKVQKTLSDVFDYLNGNNLQLVGKQLLTEVGDAHRIVENLAIHDVSKSLNSELQIGDDVLYVGKHIGTIIEDRIVKLRDGTLIASLDTQTHKFRKIV